MEYLKEEEITPKQLVVGELYITKEGFVVMYCGKRDTYICYLCGSVPAWYGSICNAPYFLGKAKEVAMSYIKTGCNPDMFLPYPKVKGIIIKDIGGLMTKEQIAQWLTQAKLTGVKGIPDFKILDGKAETNPLVKASELEIGKLYVQSNQTGYVFLGRTIEKNFVWATIPYYCRQEGKPFTERALTRSYYTEAEKQHGGLWGLLSDIEITQGMRKLSNASTSKKYKNWSTFKMNISETTYRYIEADKQIKFEHY